MHRVVGPLTFSDERFLYIFADDTVERLYSQKKRKVDHSETNGGAESKEDAKGRKVCFYIYATLFTFHQSPQIQAESLTI